MGAGTDRPAGSQEQQVALVTDSGACIASGPGLTVAPLHVLVGDRRGAGSREVTPAELTGIMRAGRERVSTSGVSPGEFVTAYRELASLTGCRTIISVHLSGRVSGTAQAARQAGLDVAGEVEVRVIDSQTFGMALGFAVQDGAALAARGAHATSVVDLIEEQAASTRTWFYLDTLEHLRRGGRVGRAQAVLGSALAIKPLLTITDGEVAVAERVRTRGRALARLVDLAAQACADLEAEGCSARVAVQHLDAAEAAVELAAVMSSRTGVEPLIVELDAGVGVHSGPGTLALVVGPARS